LCKNSKQQHIVKVIRQEGEKVYFKLTAWDTRGSGGYPRSPSLSQAVNLVLKPFVDSTFPNGANDPTGDFDPNNFNLYESRQLKEIVDNLSQPPNREELTTLAKLVIAQKYGQLDSNAIFSSTILDDIILNTIHPRQIYTIVGEDIASIVEVRGIVDGTWLNNGTIYEEIPSTISWRADEGSEVSEDLCEIYIVNVNKSEIKTVKAYYTDEQGFKSLRSLPSNWYTKHEEVDLNSLTITAISLNRKLTKPWEPKIYVSFVQEHNTPTNVINDILNKYTDINVQEDEITDVSASDLYTLDFTLYDRPDALSVIRQICYQSRLGFAITAIGSYRLIYLSSEPEAVFTFDSSNIIENSKITTNTPTESLQTVFESVWTKTGVSENKIYTARYNTKKLGRIINRQNYFCYRHREWVEKSTTFHLIRNSQSFEVLTIVTDLRALGLELLDTVLVDNVKCQIISKITSLSNFTITLVLTTPIRENENEIYDYYWPSDLAPTTVWPPDDTNENIGRQVTGTIPCQ